MLPQDCSTHLCTGVYNPTGANLRPSDTNKTIMPNSKQSVTEQSFLHSIALASLVLFMNHFPTLHSNKCSPKYAIKNLSLNEYLFFNTIFAVY